MRRSNYSPVWGRYQVTNRITRETATVDAQDAYTACDRLGWAMSRCDVIPCGPYVQLPDHEKQAILKGRWAR